MRATVNRESWVSITVRDNDRVLGLGLALALGLGLVEP